MGATVHIGMSRNDQARPTASTRAWLIILLRGYCTAYEYREREVVWAINAGNSAGKRAPGLGNKVSLGPDVFSLPPRLSAEADCLRWPAGAELGRGAS